MLNKNAQNDFLRIIDKYIEGKASSEEINFLNRYYDDFEKQPDLLESKSVEQKIILRDEILSQIMSQTASQVINKGKVISIFSKNWHKVAAAAAVILLILLPIYILNPFQSKEIAKNNPAPLNQLKNDVAPGGNKAILTLGDGSIINLDSAKSGMLAQHANIKVIKLDDGQVAYRLNKGAENLKTEYNTITTPRGGQYQLELSDGSKVWLNAESSIRFPVTFTGVERDVEITGEVYFEVFHNAQLPFHVKVNDIDINVLGTHFNVNAYSDENIIKTTLLEGSVKVSKGKESALIIPGQQVRVAKESGDMVVKSDVDLDEVVAWKNGLFNFNEADLKKVMGQLSRWYDINIIYENPIPEREFGGEMERSLNLSQVLQLLEKNNIHFKIDGKNLIVKP
jgi:transmembrane sensor